LFFDDFHFCRSRIIGLHMTENRIFTLCRMITWVVFLRMFWNFISSLPVKRGGSLWFLTIFTFAVPELLDLIWRKIGLYQQLNGEERRIPFILDDFHFCHSRVIGLDMTENRIFTLFRMITWVVFLRMFWNFISSLPVKRGGSLLFLVGTISNVLVTEIGWTDVGSGGYILVSCAHSNTSLYYN
jgi:uncharacterized membrane protein (GlpM family)